MIWCLGPLFILMSGWFKTCLSVSLAVGHVPSTNIGWLSDPKFIHNLTWTTFIVLMSCLDPFHSDVKLRPLPFWCKAFSMPLHFQHLELNGACVILSCHTCQHIVPSLCFMPDLLERQSLFLIVTVIEKYWNMVKVKLWTQIKWLMVISHRTIYTQTPRLTDWLFLFFAQWVSLECHTAWPEHFSGCLFSVLLLTSILCQALVNYMIQWFLRFFQVLFYLNDFLPELSVFTDTFFLCFFSVFVYLSHYFPSWSFVFLVLSIVFLIFIDQNIGL